MKKTTFILLLSIFWSCNNVEDPKGKIDFDRTALLDNYASNFILPGFNKLEESVGSLNENIQKQTSVEGLASVREIWVNAYKDFLNVSAYNFGPTGEQVLLKSFLEEVATFPISTSKINSKIDSQDFGLNDFERDTRGFLALEYLIFSENSWGNGNALLYAKDLSQQIYDKTIEANNGWQQYKTEFVDNDGTAAGSSVSSLYNEFVKSFEALKNFKIGLPLGLRPGQTTALPENVESLYAGLSRDFAKIHFENIEHIWMGSNGLGFKDYLQTVEGGPELIVSTEAQLSQVRSMFEKVDNVDFLPANIDQNQDLIDLHTELQKLTRFFKSEMSSVLGIAITFSSGDGD